jgi:hypothetical protein
MFLDSAVWALGYLGTKQRYAVLLPNIQPDTHIADLAKAPSIPLHYTAFS